MTDVTRSVLRDHISKTTPTDDRDVPLIAVIAAVAGLALAILQLF